MPEAERDGLRASTAAVVPFARPAFRQGWTTQDRADFERVRRTLAVAGLDVETDEGVSDEGDPWFVILRRGDEEVLLHIARIGREYVIAGPALNSPLRGSSLRALVEEYARCQSLWVPLAREGGGKIFVHPAALVVAVIVTLVALAGEAAAGEAVVASVQEGDGSSASVLPPSAIAAARVAPPHQAHLGEGRRSGVETAPAIAALVAGFAMLATGFDTDLPQTLFGRDDSARVSGPSPRWLAPLPSAEGEEAGGASERAAFPPLQDPASHPQSVLATDGLVTLPPDNFLTLSLGAELLPDRILTTSAPAAWPPLASLVSSGPEAPPAERGSVPEQWQPAASEVVSVQEETRPAKAALSAGGAQVGRPAAASGGPLVDAAPVDPPQPLKPAEDRDAVSPLAAERLALLSAVSRGAIAPQEALVETVGERNAGRVLLTDSDGEARLATVMAEGGLAAPSVFLEAAAASAAFSDQARPFFDASAAEIVASFASRVESLAWLVTGSELLLFDPTNLDSAATLVTRSWEMPSGFVLSLLGGREDFPADLFLT